jgi:hypothetical protein
MEVRASERTRSIQGNVDDGGDEVVGRAVVGLRKVLGRARRERRHWLIQQRDLTGPMLSEPRIHICIKKSNIVLLNDPS